eukprot:scaffold88805_cov18-Tisochrysis_lutea.AAC.2
MGVVGERDKAVYTICEGGSLGLCDVVEVLAHYFLDRVKSEAHDCRVLIPCVERHASKVSRLFHAHATCTRQCRQEDTLQKSSRAWCLNACNEVLPLPGVHALLAHMRTSSCKQSRVHAQLQKVTQLEALPAAVVKTMNMDFQPLFTLFTRASTICDRQRMMSSRISTACHPVITARREEEQGPIQGQASRPNLRTSIEVHDFMASTRLASTKKCHETGAASTRANKGSYNQTVQHGKSEQRLRPHNVSWQEQTHNTRTLAHTPTHLTLTHHHHKWAQEVILESVVGELVALQELHGQLAQALHRVHGNSKIGVAANGHKKVRQHRPDAAPNKPADL